jgi:hypothetical protein
MQRRGLETSMVRTFPQFIDKPLTRQRSPLWCWKFKLELQARNHLPCTSNFEVCDILFLLNQLPQLVLFGRDSLDWESPPAILYFNCSTFSLGLSIAMILHERPNPIVILEVLPFVCPDPPSSLSYYIGMFFTLGHTCDNGDTSYLPSI